MPKNISIKMTETIADEHYPLKKITYEMEKSNGEKAEITREVYQPSNAVTVLLYSLDRQTILLTKQFRLAAFINGYTSGMLLETCAGLIENNESPEETIQREIEEETGYKVKTVEKLFELYSTPGAVTEKVYYYKASYNDAEKVSEGGGLANEQEDIEVIEMPFEEAYTKVTSGEIQDAKTVVLLQYARMNLFKAKE
jgi:GDP-mannose pyrophosphatase NudK